jgi:hypothetical protein
MALLFRRAGLPAPPEKSRAKRASFAQNHPQHVVWGSIFDFRDYLAGDAPGVV